MYSQKGRRWTKGIIIVALLAMGSLLAYDLLWGAALVQSNQPAVVQEEAPQPPTVQSPTDGSAPVEVQGEDGLTYTVDADGTVRDANGNIVGQAEIPAPGESAPVTPTQ